LLGLRRNSAGSEKRKLIKFLRSESSLKLKKGLKQKFKKSRRRMFRPKDPAKLLEPQLPDYRPSFKAKKMTSSLWWSKKTNSKK
jgi:hypothetical protein